MSENIIFQKKSKRKFEITRLTLSFLPALLIGLAFGLGKIVRDCSLTCNVGYEFYPVAILAIGILSLPVSAIIVRFAGRLGYRQWQIWSLGIITVGFLVFWASAYFIVTSYPSSADTFVSAERNLPVRFIYLGFYIWLGAVGTIFAPNIKSTVYKLYPRSGRAKALAWTNSAFILGGLLGGLLASVGVPLIIKSLGWRYELARDILILAMGFVVFSTIPVIMAIDRFFKREYGDLKIELPKDEMDAIDSGSANVKFRTATQWIASDKKLRRMAGLILMRGIAEIVLIYLFYWLVTEQTNPFNGRTVFFADFYILLNMSTLLMLLLGTNRLINRYGLVFALLTLPIALFLGTTYLIIHTVMLVTYILRILDAALEQSIFFQGMDRMLLEVNDSRAPVIRPILQGLVVRIGRSLGAMIILALTLGIGVSFTHMTVFYVIVITIWILISLSLRSALRRA